MKLRTGLDTCLVRLARLSEYPGANYRTAPTNGRATGASISTAAAASLILLSACASKPAIEVRTVEVLKPVPVACVKREDIPVRPGPLPPRPEDARQALDLAVAWVLKWQGYGEKANAVLQGCVSQ